MPEVAQATITVTPVMAGAQEKITTDLTGAATPAGQKAGSAAGSSMLKSLGDKMSGAGTTMTKYMTGPVTAVGAAAGHAWKEVDTGLDTIVKKTGASGEALEEMRTSLNNITTSIPVDFDTAGAAIGEVNTRFGLTGQELEDLSAQFVKFSKLTNTDVAASVDSVQKALSAFGLGADDAEGLLDALNATGQATGASVDTLTNGLVQNATAFQELGLDIDQSVALMGQLETSGANSETVMQGLRKALKNAAEDGVPLNEALADLQDTILNGKDGVDGLTAAYDMFGKSGDQIYGAIQNGTLDFSELGNAALDAGGSVSDAFEGTLSPMDDFTTTMNELKILGADIVESAGPALVDIFGSVSDGISAASDAWNNLSPEMQDTIIKVAGIAAVVGPLLVIGGKVVGGISTIAGGLGSLASTITGFGSAAAGAAAPIATAGVSFGAMAGQALQLIAVAGSLYIVSQAVAVLADSAISVADAGWPAIAVLGGMAAGVLVLMGAAAALGPALTAGAVGIGVFGAAMLAIGGGIDLACTGVAKVTDAVSGLVDTISTDAPQINSIVTNVGDTVDGTITTISDGVTQVVDAVSGGVSGVLDSFSGVIDSIGEAALNAGTGFDLLANAVINLVSNTGVLDLAATLGAVATGVSKINDAADEAGSGATKINTLTTSIQKLNSTGANTGRTMTAFGTTSRNVLNQVASSFKSLDLASSMRDAIDKAIDVTSSGLSTLESMFDNTHFSFEQHISVPHFSMSGSFNAQTGSTPSISTSWYRIAESSPYRFNGATLFGAGEHSDEILYGRDAFLRDIKEAVGGSGVNVYVTVDGAENPEEWADRFAREFVLKARTA